MLLRHGPDPNRHRDLQTSFQKRHLRHFSPEKFKISPPCTPDYICRVWTHILTQSYLETPSFYTVLPYLTFTEALVTWFVQAPYQLELLDLYLKLFLLMGISNEVSITKAYKSPKLFGTVVFNA